jgi:hypothetical protein
MDLIDFHRMRTAVQENSARAGDDDVVALERKVWSGLVSTGVFADVEVGHTDDPDRLVIAMCRFPGQVTADEAADALERLWLDRLRYGYWEAHATLVTRGQAELEAASRAESGHFVTLHVLAQQSPIPAQRGPSTWARPAVTAT